MPSGKKGVFLWLLLWSSLSLSANLGTYGQLYSIEEPDILEWIQTHLQDMQASGELDRYQEKVTQEIKAHVLRPRPTELPRASQNKVSYYSPTFTVSKNVVDAQGKVLFKAGTSVNALDEENLSKATAYAGHVAFNERLIFINADDPIQVDFAKIEASGITKIILVKGNIIDASKNLGRIYFDQGGTLTHRFGIQAVPAVISREGRRLKIEERLL